MKYVAAYALAVLGGKEHPTAADLKHILEAVGAEFDQAQADSLVKALAGKAIHEVIQAAQGKMASLPVGGAALPAAAAAPAASTSGKPADKKEAKKEEKKEEEEDVAGGAMDLFGGEEW